MDETEFEKWFYDVKELAVGFLKERGEHLPTLFVKGPEGVSIVNILFETREQKLHAYKGFLPHFIRQHNADAFIAINESWYYVMAEPPKDISKMTPAGDHPNKAECLMVAGAMKGGHKKVSVLYFKKSEGGDVEDVWENEEMGDADFEISLYEDAVRALEEDVKNQFLGLGFKKEDWK